MSATISATQSAANTTFVVCAVTAPGGTCTCNQSQQQLNHHAFTFGPKPQGDTRTDLQWQQACAGEARLLVDAQIAKQTSTALTSLVQATVQAPPA